MRFKVDENLPVDVAVLLRSTGHDADTVADEKLGGAPDPDLAAICLRDQRALITLDRGFTDIRTYPPAEYCGIVVLRPAHEDRDSILRLAARVAEALGAHPLDRHLWIVEPAAAASRGRRIDSDVHLRLSSAVGGEMKGCAKSPQPLAFRV